MNIDEMTSMSYFLLVMAGILAVAAVILFFLLDIPKCVRMVFGKSSRHWKKSGKATMDIHKPDNTVEKMPGMTTEKLDVATLPLYDDDRTQPMGSEETLPLIYEDILEDFDGPDSAETELIDTKELELIQDIVYVQNQENNRQGTE